MTEKHGTIVKVAGPLITASGMGEVQMYDVVHVSDRQLIGEVIELRGDTASVQVYEETGGIGPGEPVYPTGAPLSVELGPGLIESIYDGIQRPLTVLFENAGSRITRALPRPRLTAKRNGIFSRRLRSARTLRAATSWALCRRPAQLNIL